jgi:hypothetical protein
MGNAGISHVLDRLPAGQPRGMPGGVTKAVSQLRLPMLAGKMPARTGRMPALPKSASQQSLTNPQKAKEPKSRDLGSFGEMLKLLPDYNGFWTV